MLRRFKISASKLLVWLFTALLYSLLLTCASKAVADDVADQITVGTILSNPPYVMQSPSAGIDIDIIREAFASQGIEAIFVHAPLARVEILLETGKVDALTTFRKSDVLCSNSEIFSWWHDGISVPQNSTRDIGSVADLKGLRIGTFPGAARVLPMLTEADLAGFANHLTIFNTELVLKMLERGRIDAYIGDYWAMEYRYYSMKGAKGEALPYRVVVEFPPTPRRLCVREKAVLKAFNAGLAKLHDEGTDKVILAHYLTR